MLRPIHVLLTVLVALASTACLGTGSSINAYGGVRSLDSEDFDGVDDQKVYGADAVLKLEIPWLAVEGGWLHSQDDTSSAGQLLDAELGIDEYFVGLRVTPWTFLVEPYGAVGVGLVDGDLDATVSGQQAGDTDSALGYYARVGAAIRFGLLRLGLDGRAGFSGDLDLQAVESDVNNYQLTAFIGLAF
jgi:hypothetical protein